MNRVIYTLPLVAMLAACSSLSPQEDPVYLRLNDIEARLMRMERVFENESLIQLAGNVDQLRSDVQELRGEVETLGHEMENQAERQRDLYLDVDSRLQALEQGQGQASSGGLDSSLPQVSQGGAAGPGQSGSSGGGSSSGGDSPEQQYDRAFELIQAREYAQAATAFREFLADFPDHNYASNAQYWLAETFYVRGQFGEALPEFQAVLDEYPRSQKIPDALLKVGYCNYELGNLNEARRALREVQAEYPDTTAARLAAQRLQQIAQESG